MKFVIKSDKRVSLDAFISELRLRKTFNDNYFEKDFGLYFTQEELKRAVIDHYGEVYEKVKGLHDELWDKYKDDRKNLKKDLENLIKSSLLGKAVELIPQYTKKGWFKEKCKTYLVLGRVDRNDFSDIYMSFWDGPHKSLIQNLIHELIHYNSMFLSIDRDNEMISNSIEIATTILTNMVSKELGIQRVQEFYGSFKKYQENYEELQKLYYRSENINDFIRKIQEEID